MSSPERPIDQFEGRIVLNYRIGGRLGQGAFGSVYRATHVDLGREVAVKILLPQHATRPDVIERFLREAKVVCDIGHPDIVTVENAGRLETGEPFYMMELVEGRSLADLVATDGPMAPGQFRRLFASLAAALEAAHEAGVIHRDLKPRNVMVRERDGEILGGKLLDFGIAKMLHDVTSESQTGDVLGTPHFMAPEQVEDAKHVDARADVYAFAATVFYALTAARPIDGSSVPAVLNAVLNVPAVRLDAVAPVLGRRLADVIAQCLEKQPARRPATLRAAWTAIDAEVAKLPPTATARRVIAPSSGAPGGTLTDEEVGPRRGRSSPEDAGPVPSAMAHGATLPATTPPGAPRSRASEVAASVLEASTRPPAKGRRGLVLGLALASVAGLASAVFVARRGAGDPPTVREAEGTPSLVDRGAGGTADAAVATSSRDDVTADAAAVVVTPEVDAATGEVVVAATPDAGPSRSADSRSADSRSDSRRTRPRGPSRNGTPTVTSPVPTVQAAPPPREPDPRCARGRFAAVYQAARPDKAQVTEALQQLKTCLDQGDISRDEYSRIQAALVAKM